MIPTNITKIMQTLLDNMFDAYIIGGAVRDILLGRIPRDWDIFTNATGKQILSLFPTGNVIGGEERQAKILTVIKDGVEISQYRKNGKRTEVGNNLKDHLKTCDFTINAMAMDIEGNIIDNHNGTLALNCKRICFVGNGRERAEEDPLRILRGIRFCLRYGFDFDYYTFKVIAGYNITGIPSERIREELFKILEYKDGINRLSDLHLMIQITPEIKKCNIDGGEYHNERVLTHMEYAFEFASDITDNTLLKFVIWLHDIGKGESIEEVKEGIHFYGHDKVGAEIAETIMNRLKFSKEKIKYVTTLIRLHMYSYKGEPKKRSYIKFFAKLEDANIPIEDYIMLLYCDHQANMKKPRIKFGDFIADNWLYKKYFECKYSNEPFTVKDLEVGGKDLIKLGMKPGRRIGDVLGILFYEVMESKLKNFKPDLMIRVKEILGVIK